MGSAATRSFVSRWAQLGPQFLPFADAASPDLPLPRLLRLALFQVSVGMALVLMVGTLNRVMIVELRVPSAVVAIMVSLPVLWAPLRALIGFRSDHHRSALGWRRVPYIWMGTLIQFGGLALMPWALLVLSGGGNSASWPAWLGPAGAGLAFLLVGAGLHITQTAGLALATDLAPAKAHPKVVGLMYVMLLFGSMVSAFGFGAVLVDFSPARLIQVIQACALLTLVLNTVSLWKQETRRPARLRNADAVVAEPSFRQAWADWSAEPGARQRLWVIGLGTMAFAMQDVLLEPFGGQVLSMSVGGTTWLSATLALGGLLGFGLASRWLGADRLEPLPLAAVGVAMGIPAFLAVIASAWWQSTPLFVLGAFGIGFGAGLFGHGTLTATMRAAPEGKEGLALGAWGAAQATAAGVAVAAGGVLRDLVNLWASQHWQGAVQSQAAAGYAFVYALEVALLVVTVVVLARLISSTSQRRPSWKSTTSSS